MAKHATVEEYVASLDGWQAEVASRVRAMVRETVPGAEEAIKWAQPVWSSHGPFAYMKAFKNHLNLGFWRGASLEDPKGLVESGGKKMGHVRITSGAELDWDYLRALVRQAAALNELEGDPTRG